MTAKIQIQVRDTSQISQSVFFKQNKSNLSNQIKYSYSPYMWLGNISGKLNFQTALALQMHKSNMVRLTKNKTISRDNSAFLHDI